MSRSGRQKTFVCVRCGTLKPFLASICLTCGWKPNDLCDLARAYILSSEYVVADRSRAMSSERIQEVAAEIKGGQFQFDPAEVEEVEAFLRFAKRPVLSDPFLIWSTMATVGPYLVALFAGGSAWVVYRGLASKWESWLGLSSLLLLLFALALHAAARNRQVMSLDEARECALGWLSDPRVFECERANDALCLTNNMQADVQALYSLYSTARMRHGGVVLSRSLLSYSFDHSRMRIGTIDDKHIVVALGSGECWEGSQGSFSRIGNGASSSLYHWLVVTCETMYPHLADKHQPRTVAKPDERSPRG